MKTIQTLKSMPALFAACAVLTLAFFGCRMPGEMPDKPQKPAEIQLGSISGKVTTLDSENLAGITVTLEKTDGQLSLSVISAAQSIAAGNDPGLNPVDASRSINAASSPEALTTTDEEGFYSFSNVMPGTYTIYASSPASLEKAVTTNVTLNPGGSVMAAAMSLTPTGTITGRIMVDEKEYDNYGFLVCAEGTSYMAVTGYDGSFEISDVPVGNYSMIIIKGHFTYMWMSAWVSDDTTTNLTTKHLSSEQVNANPIRTVIQNRIYETRIYTGNYGHTKSDALYLTLAGTGVDLDDDVSMKILFAEIEGIYVHLDFTGVKGKRFYHDHSSDSISKDRILSITLDSSVVSIIGSEDNQTYFGEMSCSTFYGYTALESITAPGVTSLSCTGLEYCNNLNSVRFPSYKSTVYYTSNGIVIYFIPIKKIKHLTLGITSIGNDMFINCTNLESVEFPKSASIGSNAFANCSSLESVNIPLAESIGAYAFDGCSSLKSVKMPKVSSTANIPVYQLEHLTLGLQSIAASQFEEDKTILISADFPEVTSIGNFAFTSCTTLTSVYFPKATSIGNYAFQNCTSLESAEFPLATGIGSNAFANCAALTGISIPASVTSVGSSAFAGCSNLRNISIGTDKVTHTLTNNWGTRFPATNLNVTFLNGVVTIGDYSFDNCSRLSSVTIPNSVTSIGNYAFSGCTGLSSVSIPNSVISIGDSSFRYCSGINILNIPNSVEIIWDNAFQSCTGLINVIIPDSVTIIWEGAFASCTGLSSVVLGSSVAKIEEHAFYGCNALTSVTFKSNISSVNFSIYDAFPGDLRDKYLAAGGGIGTYTTANPGTSAVWVKQ